MTREIIAVLSVAATVGLVTLVCWVLVGRIRRRRQPDPLPFPEPLSGEEVAYRIGVATATRPRFSLPLRLPQAVVVRSAPSRAAGPESAARMPSARERLLRDTGAALAGLAAVILLAVAFWPPAFSGGVLGIVAAPTQSAAGVASTPTLPIDQSGGTQASPGDSTVESPTPLPSKTPDQVAATAGSSSNANPRPRSTPRPTPSPRATPTPTPRPTVGITPVPTPTPTPTPGETPMLPPAPTPQPPQPTPTPDVTPTPTPEVTPTPTPTPDGTPTPTPDGTPTPTPTPTP